MSYWPPSTPMESVEFWYGGSKKVDEEKRIDTTPSPPVSPSLPNECNCNRAKSQVFCKRCGYTLNSGRAKRTCSLHPKVIHMMDLGECPKCRASCNFLVETPNNLVQ